ncbi:hypothetical protein K1719_030650 [Acacia pycnantha]|nr:hypothetical protein K1719_030650 [Acacia pycnantha]
MVKKSSKKTPSQARESTIVEEQKPSSHEKQGSEIDEMFAGLKRKKSEAEKTEKSDDVSKRPKKAKKNMKKSKVSAGVGDIIDPPPSRPRKTTEDGLAIYTEEELGINKADAGSTPLCPFDCSCCF